MASFPDDMTHTVAKVYENANAIMSAYLNAASKSNAAAIQGIEDMSRNVSGLVQDSVTRAISACQTIMSAKSPQEAAETHAEYMKECFDTIVASGGKISEVSLHAAKSTIDPLAKHANDAMGTLMNAAKSA